MTFELHESLIFLIDPLKPQFYYIRTGLRGSIFTQRYFHDEKLNSDINQGP